MGVQPQTLQTGADTATASTDTLGSHVGHHVAGERRRRAGKHLVTISGTAADSGGGRVAASKYRSTAARPGGEQPVVAAWSYSLADRRRTHGEHLQSSRRRQRQSRNRRRARHRTVGSGTVTARARSGRPTQTPPAAPMQDPSASRARNPIPFGRRRLRHGDPFLQTRRTPARTSVSLWSTHRDTARRR